MSDLIKGVVSNVSSKDWNGTMLYSFQVDGDRRWFRTGDERPPMENGDAISFTCIKKGTSNNVRVDSINKVDASEVNQAPPARRSSGGAQTSQGYWEERQKREVEVVEPRIVFSAAQSSAIALVSSALQNDAIGFGSAKVGDKLDMLLDMVDQVTERFVEQRLSATQETLAEMGSQ